MAPVTPGLKEAMEATDKGYRDVLLKAATKDTDLPLRIPVVRGGPWGHAKDRWEVWRNDSHVSYSRSFRILHSTWYHVHSCKMAYAGLVRRSDILHAPKDCTELPETDGSVIFFWVNDPPVQVGDWVEYTGNFHVDKTQCCSCMGKVQRIGSYGSAYVVNCRPPNLSSCSHSSCSHGSGCYKRIPSLRAPEGVTLRYVTAEEYGKGHIGALPRQGWSIGRGVARYIEHSRRDAQEYLELNARIGETWLVVPPRDHALYPEG